jgi:hypothetical protein
MGKRQGQEQFDGMIAFFSVRHLTEFSNQPKNREN